MPMCGLNSVWTLRGAPLLSLCSCETPDEITCIRQLAWENRHDANRERNQSATHPKFTILCDASISGSAAADTSLSRFLAGRACLTACESKSPAVLRQAGFVAEAFAEILHEIQPCFCMAFQTLEDRCTVFWNSAGLVPAQRTLRVWFSCEDYIPADSSEDVAGESDFEN